ncbi:uncharacterized protein LOC129286293 [Prosopis cineraria]|uniref:uncharacterized protein LOC129286293 n=1 Tax=Prosopis cineraria TaxID=364024 RepID=UPI00240EC977|nr:uncharacterized protein LOC129286293 [Prosopis cineraria]
MDSGQKKTNNLIWNVRGVGGKEVLRLSSKLRQRYKFDFLALLEPRKDSRRAQTLAWRVGLTQFDCVEANGYSGGTWCFWGGECGFSGQRETCTEAHGVQKCCISGDFNATLHKEDCMSLPTTQSHVNHYFKQWADASGVSDLGFQGLKYAWSSGRSCSRNDRLLVNARWSEYFPAASVIHLLRIKSDHCPIFLKLCNEDQWDWNKYVFGDINRRKAVLMSKLEGINRQLSVSTNIECLEKEHADLWIKLEMILVQEEIMWLQRSRCNWYAQGGKNTRYFHTMTQCRKKRKRIETLKGKDGEWIYNSEILRKMETKFYKQLYAAESISLDEIVFGGCFLIIEEDIIESLGHDISRLEIKGPVFAMGPLKAAGPEGLNLLFF